MQVHVLYMLGNNNVRTELNYFVESLMSFNMIVWYVHTVIVQNDEHFPLLFSGVGDISTHLVGCYSLFVLAVKRYVRASLQ